MWCRCSRRSLFLSVGFTLHLFNNVAYRFLDSYLPLYASSEGVSPFGVGIIFAAFSFAIFVFSPVWGHITGRVGYRSMMVLGLTVESIVLLCYPLSRAVSAHHFIVVVTLMRTLQGVGSAATQTGCYSLIAAEASPDGSGAGGGMGGMEMVGGLGSMGAPVIAGALYTRFGFSTPPVAIACLGIACVYIVATLLPSKEAVVAESDADFITRHTHAVTGSASQTLPLSMASSRSLSSLSLPIRAYVGADHQSVPTPITSSSSSSTPPPSCTLLDLLRVPSVLYCCLVSVVSLASVSFLGATLEAAFASQHRLSSPQVGGCFALASLAQLLLCPIAGWMSDRFPPRLPILAGLCISTVALLLLGPSPLLPSLSPSHSFSNTPSLPLQLFSLALLGCGVSLAVIPTFVDQLRATSHLPPSSSHPLIAGLSASVFSLGEVLGPLLGTAWVERFGFGWGCTAWAVGCGAVLGVGVVVEVGGWVRRVSRGEAYETIGEVEEEGKVGGRKRGRRGKGRERRGRREEEEVEVVASAKRLVKGKKGERTKGGETERKGSTEVSLQLDGGDDDMWEPGEEEVEAVDDVEPSEDDHGGDATRFPQIVFVQRRDVDT